MLQSVGQAGLRQSCRTLEGNLSDNGDLIVISGCLDALQVSPSLSCCLQLPSDLLILVKSSSALDSNPPYSSVNSRKLFFTPCPFSSIHEAFLTRI